MIYSVASSRIVHAAPRNEYADTVALLVGRTGATMFMITLVAPDGDTADSVRPQLLELGEMVLSRLQ